MILGLGRTRYSPIAIDFGADAIKLLQLIPGDPPQLVAAATEPVPPQFRADPAGRNACHVELLKRLLKQHPFKGRRAICSIPTSHTLIQHIQVAKAENEAALDEQVRQHLRQRMNVDPTRMVIRHFNVGTVVREGSSKQEVICIAASREAVMRHIESAHRAKLDVVGMHAEPMALLRAFGHLYRRAEDAERTTMFIDLGAVTTKVVIAHGSQMVFAKTIHAAGDHLTRAYARRKKLEFAAARKQRIADTADTPRREAAGPGPAIDNSPVAGETSLAGSGRAGTGFALLDSVPAEDDGDDGISLTGGSGGGTATATAPAAATATAPLMGSAARTGGGGGGDDDAAVYDDVLDCMIDELQLAVRYHQSTFPGRAIEKLVFLGGESHHVELCQRLAKALRIAAQLGDPLARLVKKGQGSAASALDMRRPQPGWAVPLGLSLSEANL